MDTIVSPLCARLANAAETAGFVVVERGSDWLDLERRRGFFVPSGPGLVVVQPTWSCRLRVHVTSDRTPEIVLSRLSHRPVWLVRSSAGLLYIMAGICAVAGTYGLVTGAFQAAAICAAGSVLFPLIGRYFHILRIAPLEMIANRDSLKLLIGAISSETDAPLSVRTVG